MPLPQLNTQGNDQTNTLLKIQQMNSVDAQDEDRRIASQQRNALFELQKRKADEEMAPDVVKLRKDLLQLQVAKENALAQNQIVETKKATGGYFFKTLAAVPKDPELKAYKAFLEKAKNDPMFKDYVSILPDPDNYLQDDVRYESGKVLTPEMDKLFTQNYSSIVESAKKIYEGKNPSQYIKVQIPNGKGGVIVDTVAVDLAPGESVEQYLVKKGYPAGTKAFVKEDEVGGDKAPKNAETIKVKGDDGEIYEVTRHWDTKSNSYVEDGRVKVKDLTAATTKVPTEKDATVEATFVNKAGVQIVQMKDGSQWKQVGGKRVPVEDEDLIGMQRIGDVMSPLMQDMLDRNGKESAGASVGTGIVDAVRTAGKAVKEKFTGKPSEGETGTVTKPIPSTPTNPVKVKSKMSAEQIESIRAEVKRLLDEGKKDPEAVKARFKELTGTAY